MFKQLNPILSVKKILKEINEPMKWQVWPILS